MPSAVRLREDYSAAELRALALRTSTRAGGFCRWRRFATGWTAARRRRSAEWTARRCATGCTASTPPGPRASSTIGRRVPSLACRRSNRRSSRRSSRPGRIVKDGVVRWRGSISSVSSPRGLASTFILAMSESSSGNSASPTSVRGPVIRLRTSGSSRRSKLPACAEPISKDCQRRRRSKSGLRMRPASARKTAGFGSGPGAGRGKGNPPTSVMTTPICSAPSAPPAALGLPSRCPMPTPT